MKEIPKMGSPPDGYYWHFAYHAPTDEWIISTITGVTGKRWADEFLKENGTQPPEPVTQ
jgi:hypothetical protein